MAEELIEQEKKQEPKPAKPKSKFNPWYIVMGVVLIFGIFLLINVFMEDKIDPEEGACAENLYLGHCFDMENKYFGCNILDKNCNPDSWDTVLKIRLFEEVGVVIYGKSGCDWCEKQLDEFGIYKDYVLESGMYIDCSTSSDPGCINITITPTWKENGVTVVEGFISLDKIILEGQG